jgi:hypothetical protein
MNFGTNWPSRLRRNRARFSVGVFEEAQHPLRPAPGYWFGLWYAASVLKEMGVTIHFYRRWNDLIFDHDFVVLSSRRVAPLNTIGYNNATREATYAFLDRCRSRSSSLIWLDTSDSSGTIQAEVLPFVDAYWKKQVLKDRSLYCRSFYSGRIHFDYFYRRFGIHDSNFWPHAEDTYLVSDFDCSAFDYNLSVRQILDDSEIAKLRVAWSLAYHDWRRGSLTSKIENFASDILQRNKGGNPFTQIDRASNRDRPVDAFTALFRHVGRPIQWQREMVLEIIRKRHSERCLAQEKIPYKRYLDLLKSSKICVGAFGLGEPCYREFESFASGTALLTPDLSHIDTFPNLYRAYETYQPVRWDLSDLDESLSYLLLNSKVRRNLATEGREQFRRAWEKQGLSNLAEHFLSLLNDARMMRGKSE